MEIHRNRFCVGFCGERPLSPTFFALARGRSQTTGRLECGTIGDLEKRSRGASDPKLQIADHTPEWEERIARGALYVHASGGRKGRDIDNATEACTEACPRPVLMAAKTNSMNEVEFPLSVLLLHVSARFARLFRCELDGESYGEKRPGILANWSVDVCSVSRFGRFVLFCEKDSLFVISSGYRRSLVPVLEGFHRRREELTRELGLSGLAPFSSTTVRFSKRTNRHIIGSQND